MRDATETVRSAVVERSPELTSAKAAGRSSPPASGYDATLKAVTAIVGTVVALTFIFGFGNVWTLGLRLGVPGWVAPLVAPAVDLSIMGLLLGIRHLALHGATPAELRPARRLLIFASVVTLALNVADPLIAGMVGKAAFDAVGPLLLIAWAEVGPGFLQAISAASVRVVQQDACDESQAPQATALMEAAIGEEPRQSQAKGQTLLRQRNGEMPRTRSTRLPQALVERARQEDAAHRAAHQKPISADTLRSRLGIGADRSRRLVAIVRSEVHVQVTSDRIDAEVEPSATSAETTLVA
jgi:hypothetical protein